MPEHVQRKLDECIPHPKSIDENLCFSEDQHWYYCGDPSQQNQGWKLYISCSLINVRDILLKAGSLLVKYRCHFKYLKTEKLLRLTNCGVYGYSQIGKVIVVYEPLVYSQLISELKDCLDEFRDQCPFIPFAKPIGGGLPLYYRYGAYKSLNLESGDSFVKDDRESARLLNPAEEHDCFIEHLEETLPNLLFRSFLLNYPVTASISQQGKGGIFSALNLKSDSYQEIILKVAYPNGQKQDRVVDGYYILKRSLNFYVTTKNCGFDFIPRLVDYFDDGKWLAIAMEKIDGVSLFEYHRDGLLQVAHLVKCLDIIVTFHKSGWMLGDAKIANFMISKQGIIKAIDFETSFSVQECQPLRSRTFFITNPLITDPRIFDNVHFLVSAIFPYNKLSLRTESRQVDIHNLLTEAPTNQVEEWTHARIKEYLGECN